MKLGIYLNSQHRERDDPARRLAETLEQRRLIRSLDPLLRQSEAGRAVFLTSGVTYSFPAYWAAYSVSKAALEGLVRTYAAELAQTNVRVFGVHLSAIHSNPTEWRRMI